MLNRNSGSNLQTQHPLTEIYLKLVRDSGLWTGPLDDALRTVLKAVCTALRVQRTWLWSFGPARERLTLMLGYAANDQSFTHGAELLCDQFPDYFRRFDSMYVEAISDIHRDARFREFAAQGLINAEVKAILNSAVHVASRSWGILTASDDVTTRIWSEAECWFIGSISDLISQLLTYAEVRRSEHWLRLIADTLPIAILRFDIDARCDYANPHWLQLTETDAAVNDGDNWLRSVHPDDRKLMLDTIHMVGATGERDHAELRLLVKDRTIWLSCAWVSERNVEGLPVAVLGTFADITNERKLRENERRYRTLFDNSSDGVFLGKERRAIDCNARALEMFGCTREQMIGMTPLHFSAPQPDGRTSSELLERIARAEQGEPQFFEWRYMRYDGTFFDAEVTLSFITINEEPHLLATLHDVSERRAAEVALRLSNERLHRINRITARLYGLRDIESVACASVEVLSEYGSAPLVRFFVYDAASSIVRMIAERDGRGHIHRATDKLHQRVLDMLYENDVGVMTDIDSLPTSPEKRALLRERGTRAIVYVWLRSDAERIGLIVLEYREALEFGEEQLEDLTAIGKAISMALSNVLFIARVEHQATHDTLTELSNRELLHRELDALAEAPQRTSGLMLLDLDRFKEVNDTLGHHVGDQLLIVLGRRLAEALREKNALLCRLGGDEFAILIHDLERAQFQELAECLLELLRQPFRVGELVLEIGGSIGIAMYPEQGRSGAELLRLADVAMYQAKRGGSGWVFYDRQFDSYTPDRLALMQELRGAIAQKQLVLHFQPRLHLHTNDVVGFEALVRWQHPQRGLLAPNVFLPLAEMSDVIHALTIEVLELALMQQRNWLQRGLRYSISVNLSARNLINEQCFIRLRQMIEKYESDPRLLELEITETALMQDPIGAAKLLASLATLGIKFSIDDFGTGYSSLAYLRQLPIHALKIDRSFISDMVRNEQDAMIVKSTVGLAHNLKLDVIAEGVEDNVTLQLLHDMGCDQVQGYYVSRPQPIAAIEEWLQQSSWPRLQ